MAHAYFASIEEELTCCVCFELFVNPHIPKDLDCPHVICEQCLRKLSREGSIDCPECRVVTMVPMDGVSALKTNLRVRNLAEKHKRHSTILTRKQALQLSDRQEKAPCCSAHKGENLDLFCVTCDVMVCQLCVGKNHDGGDHKIKDVKLVHQGKMTIMDVNMSRSEKIALQYEKLCQELGEAEDNILASVKRQEGTIDQAVALVVAKARTQGDLLKAKIRGRNQPKITECQKQKGALQRQAGDLRKVVTDAKEIMQDCTSHEYIIQHKKLTERLKAIQSQRYATFVDYSPYEIDISVEQLAKKIGNVDREESGSSSTTSSSGSSSRQNGTDTSRRSIDVMPEQKPIRKLTLFTKWDGFHSVACIATSRTSSMLAISEWNRNLVHIYSKQQSRGPYRNQSRLQVPDKCGTGNCSVAIAPDGRFFVTRGKSIHVYSSSGQYRKYFYTTKDTDVVDLTCLVVTRDGKVLVGDAKRSLITMHALDGGLVKSIPTNIEPTSLVAINSKQVAICSRTDNRACTINLESGKEILSFEIAAPSTICYDEKSECLLAGRNARTGLIEQYSLSTGQAVACIAHGIANPQAMTFSHDGLLVVGDQQRVTFYKASFH